MAVEYDRPMGYKLLGFVVWHGGRWYLRRRFGGVRAKLAVAGAGAGAVAAAVAIAVAACRHRASSG